MSAASVVSKLFKSVSYKARYVNVAMSVTIKLAAKSLDPLIAMLLTLLWDCPELAHVILVLEIRIKH